MKIIRWLLSHTVLILLIVAVIYGYMFWGNLLGEDTPAGKAVAYLSEEFEEVAEFVDAVKAKQSGSSQQASSEQTLATEGASETQVTDSSESDAAPVDSVEADNDSVEQAVTASKNDVAQIDTAASSIEQAPVSISYSHNDTRVVQNSEGAISTTKVKEEKRHEQPVPGTSASVQQNKASAKVEPVSSTAVQQSTTVSDSKSGKESEDFVSVEVEERLNNLDEQGKVIDASKNETMRESWIVARQSFYQRNYKLSEQSYLKVIDASESNYDAYGELGNVYFNQGKNEQAASAYYEAAAILVRQGQINRARSLIGLLRHLDKAKAIKLKKLLDSSAAKRMT